MTWYFILRTSVPSPHCRGETRAERGLVASPGPWNPTWVDSCPLTSWLQRNTCFGCFKGMPPTFHIRQFTHSFFLLCLFIYFYKFRNNSCFEFLNFAVLLNNLAPPYLVTCWIVKHCHSVSWNAVPMKDYQRHWTSLYQASDSSSLRVSGESGAQTAPGRHWIICKCFSRSTEREKFTRPSHSPRYNFLNAYRKPYID